MLFRKFILGLTLSAGLLLTSGSAMSQPLVEYAIIWVLVGGAESDVDYELCGLNVGQAASEANFEFRYSSNPYEDPKAPMPIVIDLDPGETECKIFAPTAAGALVQIVKIPSETTSDGVPVDNPGRDVIIIGAGPGGLPARSTTILTDVWVRNNGLRTGTIPVLRGFPGNLDLVNDG